MSSRLQKFVKVNLSGLHMCVGLLQKAPDLEIEQQARTAGIGVAALSKYYLTGGASRGLRVGFASTQLEKIKTMVERLDALINSNLAG